MDEPKYSDNVDSLKTNIDNLSATNVNLSLRHYTNPSLLQTLSSVIQNKIGEIETPIDFEDLSKIWMHGDYRLIADYLHSLTDSDINHRETIMDSLSDSRSEFDVNLLRYKRQKNIERENTSQRVITSAESTEELFQSEGTDN